MKWYKARINHALYGEMTAKEFYGFHRIMALTAHLEKIPTKEQMHKVCHYKTLTSLQEKLNEDSTSLQEVLNKVLIDVQEVVNQKEYWKEKKRQQREKQSNVQETSPRSQDIDKIREDKIREDKNKKSIGKNKFSPPTLEEVKLYCLERNNRVNPERFIDFYTSKGWMIGKNKMKDWKSAVRNWEKGESKDERRNGKGYGVNKDEFASLLASREEEYSSTT